MLKHLIPFFAVCPLMLVSATSPSIGVVKSLGEFRVDGSAVRGNSNVFEGNLVETASARSVIQLADAQITLAPNSSARIFRDRTVLEKGSGSVKDGANHVIEADTLRIVTSTRDSVVQVDITNPSRVTVGASGGPVEVRNASGILTASLLPGMSLAFNPRAAAASAVKMTGIMEARSGTYFLTDETTKVTIQVESRDAARYVGKKVEITGSSVPGANPAGGASQLVVAVTIKPVIDKRKAGAVVAGGAAGSAGAGAATAAPAGLNIVIVEAEGATNNTRQRTAREPIVQVEDENHKPVAGAVVVFTLPTHGAGGAFANGAHTLTTVTNGQGQAMARGFLANIAKGPYQMHVNALSNGLTATTNISMVNVTAAASAAGAGTGAGAGAAAGTATGTATGAAAGAGAAVGVSAAAVGAIVGGVAVAATAGGLAAAGTFSSDPAPISRQ